MLWLPRLDILTLAMQAAVHPIDTVKTRLQINKSTAPEQLRMWRHTTKASSARRLCLCCRTSHLTLERCAVPPCGLLPWQAACAARAQRPHTGKPRSLLRWTAPCLPLTPCLRLSHTHTQPRAVLCPLRAVPVAAGSAGHLSRDLRSRAGHTADCARLLHSLRAVQVAHGGLGLQTGQPACCTRFKQQGLDKHICSCCCCCCLCTGRVCAL